LDVFKTVRPIDKELLLRVAQTSLRTKLTAELADKMTEIVVEAVSVRTDIWMGRVSVSD
jgi:T-complex protein 1 subunit zeta